MEPEAFVAVINRLPAVQRVTDQFELTFSGETSHTRTYANQKEHLVGWLSEYNTPGYYKRQNPGQNMKFAYNHFRCAAGLLWIAEALGEDPQVLETSASAIKKAGTNPSSQCAAHRRVVPWSRIEELLEMRASRSGPRIGVALRSLKRKR